MKASLQFWGVRVGMVVLLGLAAFVIERQGLNFLPQPLPAVASVQVAQLVEVPDATPQPPQVPLEQADGLRARVLMYHYVRDGVSEANDPIGYRLSVRPAELEHHIQYLRQEGYVSRTMAQIAAGETGANVAALTFDDGYADFYSNAFPILKKYGWTATVYVISNKIGGNYLTWEQIRELHAYGIEIGAHTADHWELHKLDEAGQRQQIGDSKIKIEKEIGVPVLSLCYPVGRYNEVTLAIAREYGFSSAVTTKPGLLKSGDDRFQIKRVRMNPDMSQGELAYWLGR